MVVFLDLGLSELAARLLARVLHAGLELFLVQVSVSITVEPEERNLCDDLRPLVADGRIDVFRGDQLLKFPLEMSDPRDVRLVDFSTQLLFHLKLGPNLLSCECTTISTTWGN